MGSSVENLLQEEVFVFPASFAQQRLWFLNQLAPESPFYNVSAAICLSGHLNPSALENTFNEIVRRHESLRTNFAIVDDQLTQVIAPQLNLPLPTIDLQAIPISQRQSAAEQLAVQEAQHPFDLSQGALLRVKLLKLHDTEHILLLVLHHIVADGWSVGLLLQEISTLYTAFHLKSPSSLTDLPIQYADFAHWQREWLQGEVLETQLAYWRQQLQDAPVLSLANLCSTSHLRPAVPTYQGVTQPFKFSQSLTHALQTLSQREGVSLFMTLLAAFQTLLYRYTGQEDVVVGSPIANRNRQELEGLIGFFVNSLVLRTDLSGNPTFRALLNRVRDVTLAAYAHQDLPFEKLVQELHPQRDLSRHPIFQVAIALQNTPINALELPELTLHPLEFDSGTARLDLEFHLWQGPSGLQGQVTYSTDLFEQSTIARMLGHFQSLLEGIVSQPDQHLAGLPLLTVAEQHQLLVEWNQTHTNEKNCLCFHQKFESQVKQTPNAIAVVFEDKKLTYEELNHRSNQLAHYLKQLEVGSEVLVGICMERSLEMIVAILGILKAGGAYLPLDPTYPQERLNFMLEDAQATILVTQQPWQSTFKSTIESLQIVCLDQWEIVTQQSHDNSIQNVVFTNITDNTVIGNGITNNGITNSALTNLAYVIYTSGSTGKPKGVMIEQRGLSNLALAQVQAFNLQSTDRVLQFASLSFDASIFEIIMAFQIGATLYLAPKESLLGTALIEFLRVNAITVATLPPALLRLLPVEDLPALHTLISAGEDCSPEVVARWASPHRRIFNAYGPTEATVWATIAQIKDFYVKPSLGRAIANTQLYVLDPHLQPVPVGVAGELYIGGNGLARGYLNHPELTVERFIPNPFLGHKEMGNEASCYFESLPSQRLYKTGDLVRYHPDGSLEFLGRIDHQVKVRGHRIELGEIEAILSQHPAIRETAVVVRKDPSNNQQLVAYTVLHSNNPSPEQDFAHHELRHYLQEKLPNYLVPSVFVLLDALPLTPSGKIDRNTLQQSRLQQCHIFEGDRIDSFIAPRSTTETRLVELWTQLLNLEQVSVSDNFFELGGDSLLAMRLMDQVHQQFHQPIPLSALFQAPTIAQLAILLEKQSLSSVNPEADRLFGSSLVPLQAAGSKRPFFCIHPIFGVVFPYLELAHHLGSDQPFYGLQPSGLSGEQPPCTDIKTMANQYIKVIQTAQPQGPYLLGGWSFGGLVAFEMAQQLQQAGQQVALLALFDTLAPTPDNKPSLWNGLKFLLTTVVKSAFPFLLDYLSLITASHPSPQRTQQGRLPMANWMRLQWNAIAKLLPEESRLQLLDELMIVPMLRVFYANSQAAQRYTPKIYSDKLTLFRTTQPVGKAKQDLTLGWSQLTTKNVEVCQIPGNHLSMLRKPNVQSLAEQLQIHLERANSK